MTEQASFLFVKPTGKGKQEKKKERKAPVEITLTHHQATAIKKALEAVVAESEPATLPSSNKKRAREETEVKADDACGPSAAKKAKLFHVKAPAAGAGSGSGSGSGFCS
jgi:hypothetical protein